MAEIRWELLRATLEEALDTPPHERPAWLQVACAGDSALREEVERLLAAAGPVERFLEAPDSARASRPLVMECLSRLWAGERLDFEALVREHPGEAEALHLWRAEWERQVALQDAQGSPGTPSALLLKRLGATSARGARYRVDGEIARGGMGAILRVWDDDLRRSLAMKVALGKAHPDPTGDARAADPRALARFLEEAQVTSQLDHPGIVPVHELGIDANGGVYFTMKLVKGRDLRAILDLVFTNQEGWSQTRALGVLLKVCEAMAYAHKKGVIHRDLKPANVMVGSYGEVYVMDWGLARVSGLADPHDLRLRSSSDISPSEIRSGRKDARDNDLDSPLFTMDGTVLGTPYYMPPEQAAGRMDEIGPRSDVYAVGAMLYHLVTGRMPYHRAGERASSYRVLAMVLHGPPEPIHALRADVPPELQAICEKAMERSCAARYADMGELADDLRAFLEDRVVSAHQTGGGARLRKWIRRNPGLVMSLALLALALVGGTAGTSVQAARASSEAERARTEAMTAEEVTSFMVRLFGASNPDVSAGQPMNARDLLDRGAATAEAELGRDPAVLAEVLAAMGEAYLSLGMYREASPLIEKAVALRELQASDDPLHGRLSDAYILLAQFHLDTGDFAAAERTYLRLAERERRRRELGQPDRLASALAALAGSRIQQLRLLEGAADLAEARSLQREAGLDEHPPWILTWEACLAEKKGDLLEGERLQRLALAGVSGMPASEARALVDLAVNLIEQTYTAGEPHRTELLVEAEELCVRALGFQELLGVAYPQVARNYHNLAVVRYEVGRTEEGMTMMRRAIELRRQVLPPDHHALAQSLHNLGIMLQKAGRSEEALTSLEEAHRISVARGESVRTAETGWEIAKILQARGRPEEAAPYFDESIKVFREMPEPDDAELSNRLAHAGAYQLDRGRPELAEPLLRQALDLRRRIYEPGSWRLASSEGLIGYSILLQGRPEEAREILERAHAQLVLALKEDHPRIAISHRHLEELQAALAEVGRGVQPQAGD